MKVQNQQLEYTGLFLCSFANLSSRLFMLQDGDQILTQGTSQHFTIWGHPWPQCFSTAKERTGVVADGTSDEIGITFSTGGLTDYCMSPRKLNK
jgi:hypothetical protein